MWLLEENQQELNNTKTELEETIFTFTNNVNDISEKLNGISSLHTYAIQKKIILYEPFSKIYSNWIKIGRNEHQCHEFVIEAQRLAGHFIEYLFNITFIACIEMKNHVLAQNIWYYLCKLCCSPNYTQRLVWS